MNFVLTLMTTVAFALFMLSYLTLLQPKDIVSTVVTSILQIRNLRHKEVNLF